MVGTTSLDEPSFENMNESDRKRVAIAVPLSFQNNFSEIEETSLKHLNHFLGEYDRFSMVPQSVDFELEGCRTLKFPDKYFGSADNHSKHLMSEELYRTFEDYEYLLIYHLDALVFSDDLLKWCDAGWDYIAPPWFPNQQTEWVKKPDVGNGGFSLRKIKSFLQLITTTDFHLSPEEYQAYHNSGFTHFTGLSRFRKRYLKSLRFLHTSKWDILLDYQIPKKPMGNEDVFWGMLASKYNPDFKVAPVDQAVHFGFEAIPRHCFEMTHGQLPFGCHAWQKYDRPFWEPYLLK